MEYRAGLFQLHNRVRETLQQILEYQMGKNFLCEKLANGFLYFHSSSIGARRCFCLVIKFVAKSIFLMSSNYLARRNM